MGEGTGVFESWQKARLAGDADAIAELYEDDAVLLIDSMEVVARGKNVIRDAWAGMIAAGQLDSIDVSEHDHG